MASAGPRALRKVYSSHKISDFIENLKNFTLPTKSMSGNRKYPLIVYPWVDALVLSWGPGDSRLRHVRVGVEGDGGGHGLVAAALYSFIVNPRMNPLLYISA